jgi:hypothetical protein
MCRHSLGYVYWCSYKSVSGCFELRWHNTDKKRSGSCECDELGRVCLAAQGDFDALCLRCESFQNADPRGVRQARRRTVLPSKVPSWEDCENTDIIGAETGFLDPKAHGSIINCVKDYLIYTSSWRPTYDARLHRLDYYSDRVEQLIQGCSTEYVEDRNTILQGNPSRRNLARELRTFESLLVDLENEERAGTLPAARNASSVFNGQRFRSPSFTQSSSSRPMAIVQHRTAPSRSRAPSPDDRRSVAMSTQSSYQNDPNSAITSTRT